MIPLSLVQVRQYAVPLIYETMGSVIGKHAEESWKPEDCSEQTDVWGFFDKDVLMGIGGIGPEQTTRKVWLGYFAVKPKYRGKGLGYKILDFVTKEVLSRGYDEIYIETYNHPIFKVACHVYEKWGAERVGYLKEAMDDGSSILYFRKKLHNV